MARPGRFKTSRNAINPPTRDLISELPVEIKDRILECLPTRDAAKTALLSTHWNDVWLHHGRLVFDRYFLRTLRFKLWQNDEIVKLINNILFLRAGPVKKFTLQIVGDDLLPEQSDFDRTIKQLIVQGLVIDLPVNAVGIFSNVTSLGFLHVDFNRSVNGIIASSISIPKLEKLAFKLCKGISKFEISSPKLEILSVISSVRDVVDSRWLAPHLKAVKTLWLCGPSLLCMDVFMFPTAINLQVMKLYELRYSCGNQLAIAMQLLKKCPNLCKLQIKADKTDREDDEEASRLLEDPDRCFVIPELKMLNTIKIKSFIESALEMLFMKMLLSKSPALERFVIVKDWRMNASKVRKIIRKLTCFPRTSPNAQIVCMGNYDATMYDD